MKGKRRLLAAAMIVASTMTHAAAPMIHTLPPAKEAAWTSAVQALETADGSTVLQALQYAEKLRPTKFKVDYGGAYQGVTGDPIGISIDFWIGQKRLDGDSYAILFDVKEVDGKPSITFPTTPGSGSAAEALMAGRDSLLQFIDENYRENCIDPEGDAKLC